ncbi:MAG TPA: 30S ribosomal protein S12 methylthiotransferase RimO [Candidatus Ozemobacteraceae bacterium]
MKFHLISLGCPKNTADSELVAADLSRRGLVWVASPDEADLVMINTCGFIRDAKEESLRTIMQVLALKEERPELRVAAFGCMVKRYRDELAKEIPEIDLLFEFFSGCELDGLLAKVTETPILPRAGKNTWIAAARRFTPAHIGFLKIAEGCSNHCAYCAIPGIRGPFHSRPLNEVLHDAERLVATGAKEINIVAQDTTRFGTDHGGVCRLPELVGKVGEIPGIEWIRLHYLHPARLSPELIDALFRLPKVVPYFDIPFQHASDRMLTLMNRQTDRRHLVSLIGHIRRTWRKATLRTTLIVGFPGETEEDFAQLIEFVQAHPIDRLGAFPYSPEDGTPALKIRPRVTKPEKTRRLDELMTLQQVLAAERNGKLVGTTAHVMVDAVENGTATARLPGDAWEVDNTVTLPAPANITPGDIIKVKILSADAYDFTAEVVG